MIFDLLLWLVRRKNVFRFISALIGYTALGPSREVLKGPQYRGCPLVSVCVTSKQQREGGDGWVPVCGWRLNVTILSPPSLQLVFWRSTCSVGHTPHRNWAHVPPVWGGGFDTAASCTHLTMKNTILESDWEKHLPLLLVCAWGRLTWSVGCVVIRLWGTVC